MSVEKSVAVTVDLVKVAVQLFYQARVVIQDAVTGETLETRAHKDVSKDSTEWLRKNNLYPINTSVEGPNYRNLNAIAGVDLTDKKAYMVEVTLTVTAAPLLSSPVTEVPNGTRPGIAPEPADVHPDGDDAVGKLGSSFPDVV